MERERDHTTIDNEVMDDENALDGLRGCFIEILKNAKHESQHTLAQITDPLLECIG